ncbi:MULTISPECIES: MFS transporter [unclassified Variovorax]|uniref:MFS transporter n=1 Tax=unclassified Variovorax TaxID=663243 RepID=UPI00076CC618|nr:MULTISPECIES: MFS transporter [unclassified Variovorax]KWT98519.1 General substrate transporter [Variovorax sp. WDL1]PNG56814.1 Inner membrane metabolite transport protein YhjE [Variovorax sp. B4]PNG58238.1 Inner membrane metabolite transport protein YhjE [Variovorax sp. B2]VTV09246.1 Inner membrane metabolite transport protein YhjE [Variovorax sp. WDL1]
MSSISHTHHEPSSETLERDARLITADHSKVAPGEIAVGVVIGRASEYFDFFVYGIASVLVFPALFFPFEQRLEGTLYAFVIFSFAFIARPIGTVISMHVQRRWGRATKLTMALFLLGTSTVGIAFLPGYESAGALSIVLLSIFRVGQGLALGGSWDGLPSLLAMNAPPNRRGWYSMLGQLGAPLGFVVASGLFAFLWASLSFDDFLAWGWRYAFFVAFAINVVALFARLRLVVTHEYEQLLEEGELEPTSVVELVRTQGGNLLIGAFAALASYALFHLVTVFPLSWIRLYSDQSITEFLIIQIIGAFLAAGGIVASGWIADRVGRRRTLGTLAVMIAVFSGFAPTLLGGGTLGQDVFMLVGFVLLGLSYGQASGTVTANFARKYRYTGAALTADLAWLIGAAFAPLVALGLSANFGLAYVSVYLLSGAACTLAALSINRALEARGDES